MTLGLTAWRVIGGVALGLAVVGAGVLLARRVLSIPPGRRRWLAVDGAVLALITPLDLGIYALTGGGFFWPVFSIGALALVFGAHVWWVARTPDPAERALTRRVESLTRTRRGALDAQADDLRRIERDLHDGTQARLVSLALDLGLAESLVRTDPDAAAELLAQARQAAGGALSDLRSVMQGIRPGVLADRGLVEGVRALAVDLAVPVEVTGSLIAPLSSAAEQAVYFAVAEALANVVKHSGATRAEVVVADGPVALEIQVRDDGSGGADPAGGSGLRGIAERLDPFDATVQVTSPMGGSTTVAIWVPRSPDDA